MKLRHLLPALLLCASGPSMAAVIELGSLSVPGAALLGGLYTSAQPIEDIYNFSIDKNAEASEVLWEIDFLPESGLSIDLSSIALYAGSTLVGGDVIGPGAYSLKIVGEVTAPQNARFGNVNLLGSVGYGGWLKLKKSSGPVNVPEPGTLALFSLALIGAAFVAKRRGKQGPPVVDNGPPGVNGPFGPPTAC